MCLGKIERLVEVWDEAGTPMGRAECGAVSLLSPLTPRPALMC